MKIIIGMLAVVLATAMLAVHVLAVDVTADVTVPPTCGIVAAPTTISFSSVNAGGTSGEQTTDVTNQGSTTATVTVKGLDWSGTPGSFGVDNTLFGTASPPTTALALTDLSFASIGNGNTQTAYFKMSVPIGQAAGDYSQTITFTASC